MKSRIIFFTFWFLLVGNYAYSQQAAIHGYLQMDSTWLKKVYISRITDFNQMFTASDKLIAAEATIDSNGYFKTFFPAGAGENLYRLHTIKKGDPVSTIIIGSRDENHVFFIAADSALIELKEPGNGEFLNQQNIKGGKPNKELNNLLYALENESIPRENLKNLLIKMTDTCTSPLVGLLAVHSTFGLSANQKSGISKILARYDKRNLYGSRIFEEYKTTAGSIPALLVFLVLILPACYVAYRVIIKRKSDKIKNLLSQREKNIVQLILEGKTNKEIANTFNIELSTVKTHVNNVYAKLKINDRKELQKYENVFRVK